MHGSPASLDAFLEGIERRAYRLARFATRNDDDALDIVQDAMMGLVQRYADRPAAEWPMLFHHILQSRIRDWQRRRIVRTRWTGLWSGWKRDDADEGGPEPELPDHHTPMPPQQMALDGAMQALETALEQLPLRQQQAFLLRHWEGLDVAATARAMGCSEGSVKTHTSRALGALRAALGPHWP